MVASTEPIRIGEKAAISLRLHCPLSCGGYIENDVLLYLLEGDQLYIHGHCGECGQSGSLTVDLLELMSQCPAMSIQ